ncbi:clorobiocin biosynthesis protein CloN3 [Asanoa ferruginea]|uniref:Clorobiocin biosynthesis protein CloN3 n=1 Tax=Asanoa ferruginea TaxID=53367 RepID=A0A3D9ZNE5_9ACTN|nr:acyl-CoA dehydrogenase family protein [Asanoa ferruginea]REF98886.1 clorobiocin biosynthesis protein CloN3 [Asanoa ferruginea]GIF46432.1 acyl-CoA dehydrogenase [Asanoa ferruginea]
MNFGLSAAQRRLLEEVAVAAEGILDGPLADDPDPAAVAKAWQVATDRGLTGLCVPVEHGGRGLGALDTALALEALGAAGLDTGFAFGIAAHLLACAVPIRDFGSGALHADLLRDLATGRVAANAMTEPDAGSDVSRLATTAVPDGDGYRLDGIKSFVSNGPIADWLVVYATTDPAAGYLGVSAFAVPRTTPGVRIGPLLRKTGLRGCLAAEVTFAGCRVGAANLIGAAGAGSQIFQAGMHWERACLAAIYLGSMATQLRQCVAHARARRQFGRALTDFQVTAHRLAVMRQRLESGRLLLQRACWLLDEGDPEASTAAALAKVAVSEAVVANGLDAIQVHGSTGVLTATGVDAVLRDGLPSTIFSGSTEIQRDIIVAGLLS